MESETAIVRRLQDLSDLSRRRGFCTYSDFLPAADAALAFRAAEPWRITLWGGAEGCEKQMVRFAPEGFEPDPEAPYADFPIAVLEKRRLYNMELMNEMEQRHSVSVHVRRGDYLSPENAVLFQGITTDAYYDAAMALFIAREPRTHFYLFSDDPEYLKKKYDNPDRFTIVEGNVGRESMLDIQLMSHCHGNICANSTFSFWGARLNAHPDKVTVRPLQMRNNQEAVPARMHELWEGWVLMDAAGRVV